MLPNGHERSGLILTLITIVNSLFTCLISLIIICMIVYHLYYDLMRKRDRTIFILCGNIYLCVLMCMITLSSMNIQTILGDFYQWNFNSSQCIFVGYMCPAILGVLYYSFVNQAFFRLCRIVYYRYRWLQFYWLYLIIPPIQLILSLILHIPLLYWHDVIYLSNEHYCYVEFLNIRGFVWTVATAYGIPGFCLLVIYIRIIRYLRSQANTQNAIIQRRQARDLLAIRRILTIVSLLVIVGIPATVLVIMAAIQNEEHPLSFRITWFSITVSITGLSIITIFFIPQLKQMIWKYRQHNRIVPIMSNGSVPLQVRTNGLNQSNRY